MKGESIVPSLHLRGHLGGKADGCVHCAPETFPDLDQFLGYDYEMIAGRNLRAKHSLPGARLLVGGLRFCARTGGYARITRFFRIGGLSCTLVGLD